jgi:hypothetical protein
MEAEQVKIALGMIERNPSEDVCCCGATHSNCQSFLLYTTIYPRFTLFPALQ